MKTSKTTQQLADAWLALYESAEANQWQMAEQCHLAIEVEGDKPAAFSGLISKSTSYVLKHRTAYTWHLQNPDSTLDYGDALVVANSSDENAAALMVVAEANAVGLSHARKNMAEVEMVRTYLADNPEQVQEVLKDESTRAAVNQAAFKAATESLTEKHRGDESAKRDRVKARKDDIRTANKRLEIDKAMVNLMHLERTLVTGLGRIVSDLESNYSTQLFTADKEAAALELMDQMAEAISTQRAKVLGLRTAEAVTY